MENSITQKNKKRYLPHEIKIRKYAEISEKVKASFDNVNCNKSYIWS